MRTPAQLELDRATATAEPKVTVPADQFRIMWAEVGLERLTVALFGQLPEVPYDRLTPIARVRPPIAGEYVIGADEDGYLVRASFSDAWADVPRDDRDEQRLVDDLVRLRERVVRLEAALDARAGFEAARDVFRSLPLVLFTPERKRSPEEEA